MLTRHWYLKEGYGADIEADVKKQILLPSIP